ncbi:MAG: hypothetical protein ABIJ21_04305 [Nanoarchaeota archaeon]
MGTKATTIEGKVISADTECNYNGNSRCFVHTLTTLIVANDGIVYTVMQHYPENIGKQLEQYLLGKMVRKKITPNGKHKEHDRYIGLGNYQIIGPELD